MLNAQPAPLGMSRSAGTGFDSALSRSRIAPGQGTGAGTLTRANLMSMSISIATNKFLSERIDCIGFHCDFLAGSI
jgi:hypothetical protein